MTRKQSAKAGASGEVEPTTGAQPRLREEAVGLLKDHTTSTQRPPWAPSFSVAFRLILLVRVASALWSGIADCDESEQGSVLRKQMRSSLMLCSSSTAYNYWEPLHLISFPPAPMGTSQTPFQTWEYSPQFAIRSWAYIVQYLPLASWLPRLLAMNKVGVHECVVSLHELTPDPLAAHSFMCSSPCALAWPLHHRTAKLRCTEQPWKSSTRAWVDIC